MTARRILRRIGGGGAAAALVSTVVAAQPDLLRPGPAPDGSGVELIVTGVNESGGALPLWIRVDGPASRDFASRANLFRAVAPGPFRLRVPRADLRTPQEDALDLGTDPVIRVFPDRGGEGLADLVAEWTPPAAPPEGVIALDFGPNGSAAFPGFAAADERSTAVAGARIAPVARPGADALARDGLVGVEAITLSPAPGRYRVKLWLEDLGAWEYMPHALRRRVRINGRAVIDRADTPETWVRDHWLAGAERSFRAGDDAWTAFGARRAGLSAGTVDIGAEGLRIELAGDAPGAVFVSGLAVVPEAAAAWLETVESAQAARFRARWPVDVAAAGAEMAAHSNAPAALTLAPGMVGWLRLDAGTEGTATLSPPERDGARLTAVLRLGARRLDRLSPNSPVLTPTARTFRATGTDPPADTLGRPALVEVRAPETAAPGRYRGALRVGGRETPFTVTVAEAALPELASPVGVYLADPPHHRWFGTDPRSDRACRLRALARLGLTATSPPLATPAPDDLAAFATDVALLRGVFPNGPQLAYQQAQRLFDALPPSEAISALGMAHARAPGLVWSLADEPSNPGPHGRSLAGHVAAIRAAAHGIRLAAHLNAPADRALAPLFDVALINPGYGIDAVDLDALRSRGVEAWIYNTGPERLAAGFYGWRVGAAGYLQWHGLLPTADPFDPTDGREGDAMLLPPSGEPCAGVPTIDDRLARIAEGAADRRWLQWLDARAETSDAAAALQARLRREIPGTWAAARARLSAEELDGFRAAIAALAAREG